MNCKSIREKTEIDTAQRKRQREKKMCKFLFCLSFLVADGGDKLSPHLNLHITILRLKQCALALGAMAKAKKVINNTLGKLKTDYVLLLSISVSSSLSFNWSEHNGPCKMTTTKRLK